MPGYELEDTIILASDPEPGESGVIPTIQPRIQFSVDMDASTLNSNNIKMLTAEGSPVTVSISYSGSNRTAHLTPSAQLSASTEYILWVKGSGAFHSGVLSIYDKGLEYAWYLIPFKTSASGIESPTLVMPPDLSANPEPLHFVWNAVASATSYTIQTSRYNDFSAIYWSSTTTATNIGAGIDFTDDANYYWRVRATSGSFDSLWSWYWQFYNGEFGSTPSNLYVISVSPENDSCNQNPSRIAIRFNAILDSAAVITDWLKVDGYSLLDSNTDHGSVSGRVWASGTYLYFSPWISSSASFSSTVIISGVNFSFGSLTYVDSGSYSSAFDALATIS